MNFIPLNTPPLAEVFQSYHYYIKWTTCSDLCTYSNVYMKIAYVAVSNGTIYVVILYTSKALHHDANDIFHTAPSHYYIIGY